MLCSRYRKLLMPYSEGALGQGDAERLRRHLASCARCSEELAAITATAQALRGTEMPAMEPAGDLWARVRGEIQQTPAPRPVWGLRGFQAVSAGAVATLLLFVVLHSPFKSVEERAQEPQLSERPEPVKRDSARTLRSRSSFMDGHMKTKRIPAPEPTAPAGKTAQPPSRPASPPPPMLYVPVTPGNMKQAPNDLFASAPAPQPREAGHLKEKRGDGRSTQDMDVQFKLESQNQSGYSTAASPPPVVADHTDTATAKGAKTLDDYGEARVGAPTAPVPTAKRSADGAAHFERVEAKDKGDGLAATQPAKPADFDSLAGSRWYYSDSKEGQLQVRKRYVARLATSPKDVTAMSGLAAVEEQLGNKAAALKWRRKLAELRPREATRWVDLGRVYESILQPADAARAYKRAISLGLGGKTEAEVKDRLRKLAVPATTPANSSR